MRNDKGQDRKYETAASALRSTIKLSPKFSLKSPSVSKTIILLRITQNENIHDVLEIALGNRRAGIA